MTARRRAPRTPEQRQQQWTRSLIPGSLAGGVANASPILPGVTDGRALARGAGGAFGASGSVLAYQDVFTLTAAGAQSKTLTYLPIPHSEHVYLNGLYQRETDDWIRSDRTINVQAGMDARVGDVLAVEYLYASAVPTTPAEPDPGLLLNVPFNSDGWSYTLTNPGAGWEQPGFDDSAWTVGRAPICTADVAYYFTGTGTTVVSEFIWMRRRFPPGTDINLSWKGSRYVYIYVNGSLWTQSTTGSPASSGAAVADKAAEWVIATRVNSFSGATTMVGVDHAVTGTAT